MITVFTPVYNRVGTMKQLYDSLLKQTNFDFEWLIIDDGSNDGIVELINSWIREGKAVFDIRFYHQKNGGKHRAINRGVQLAKGDAFFIVDSDDYLVENAIERIFDWWRAIAKDNSFAGISGLRAHTNGEVIGETPIFENFIDATNLERCKYGLLGDKAEIYRTSVLKKYPFPEIENENFLTEAVVWDRIAHDGLKIRWFNEVITICEYRSDGLTSQGQELFINNPIGWGIYIDQKCNYYLSEEEKIDEYLDYYIELRTKINSYELKSNLNINEDTFIKVKMLHQNWIRKTLSKLGKSIAVYGIGSRGRKVLKIYQKTEVQISFIMDIRKICLPYLQIGLDEKYPAVDAIIVTPKESQDEIICYLKERTTSKIVGYDEWELLIKGD